MRENFSQVDANGDGQASTKRNFAKWPNDFRAAVVSDRMANALKVDVPTAIPRCVNRKTASLKVHGRKVLAPTANAAKVGARTRAINPRKSRPTERHPTANRTPPAKADEPAKQDAPAKRAVPKKDDALSK